MREILFRGKRVDSGEWIEGAVFQCDDGTVYIATSMLEPSEDGGPATVACHMVFGNSVGQYTGLTDKNGKKIFEGDIVLIKSAHDLVGKKKEDVGRVELTCIGGDWWVKSKYDFCSSSYGYHLYIMCDKETYNTDYEVEVIGNIYDNPELLEE